MKNILILFFCFLFTACSSTPYQKENADGLHRTGYSESKISNNIYRLRYLDNDSVKAYKRFLRRAAELATENKHQFFSIKDVGSLSENRGNAIISNVSLDISLNQYEATVTFDTKKSESNFDANEILKEKEIAQK